MSLSTQTSRIIYSGNGITTVFAFPYYFLDQEHLVVYLIDADKNETLQVLTTNYTVAGVADPSGGTVTMLVAPATGAQLLIYRQVPITQLVDYVVDDNFPAETHERALDKLTMIAQYVGAVLERAPRVSLAQNPVTPSTGVVGTSIRVTHTDPGGHGGSGWSPVFAVVSDGERRVMKIVDWYGGIGGKPYFPIYLGFSGFELDIANGTDIRGSPGVNDATADEVWDAITNEQLLEKLDMIEETLQVCEDDDSPGSRIFLTRTTGP